MAQGDGRDFADVPDRPALVSLYPWLLIAWGTASDTVDGRFHPAWLAATGLVAFAGLYVAVIWVRWRTGRPRASYWLLGALGLVAPGLNLAFGPDMTALFPLLTIACGAALPWVFPFRDGHGPPLPIMTVFVVAAASSLIAAEQGASDEVHSQDRRVTVTIRDDGGGTLAGTRSSAAPSGGHGLGGLRERLAAGGGTLEAGPRADGGFRLTATVPVPAPQEAAETARSNGWL